PHTASAKSRTIRLGWPLGSPFWTSHSRFPRWSVQSGLRWTTPPRYRDRAPSDQTRGTRRIAMRLTPLPPVTALVEALTGLAPLLWPAIVYHVAMAAWSGVGSRATGGR